MHIRWESRQGTLTPSNNDAAAIGIGEHIFVSIIVDAAQSRIIVGNKARELSQHWCQTVAKQILQHSTPLCPERVIQTLRNEQAELRKDYLHEIASYCLVIIAPESGQYLLLHCGDCIATVTNQSSDPRKASRLCLPHTLEEQYRIIQTEEHSDHERSLRAKSTLTRTLNAKRFHPPETFLGVFESQHSLTLSSDGHWRGDTSDDHSSLVLAHGTPSIQCATDCENLFVFDPAQTHPLVES